MARFRQIAMDQPMTHHDALEFPNGQILLLTRLTEGQTATVLQMPAMPRTDAPVHERPETTPQVWPFETIR